SGAVPLTQWVSRLQEPRGGPTHRARSAAPAEEVEVIARVRPEGRHLSKSAKSGPPREPPRPAPPPPPGWRRWLLLIGAGITVALLLGPAMTSGQGESLSYSEFTARVDADQVAEVTIDENGAVEGKLTNGDAFTSRVPTVMDNRALIEQLQDQDVDVSATHS